MNDATVLEVVVDFGSSRQAFCVRDVVVVKRPPAKIRAYFPR
jgi:hypothetical protein